MNRWNWLLAARDPRKAALFHRERGRTTERTPESRSHESPVRLGQLTRGSQWPGYAPGPRLQGSSRTIATSKSLSGCPDFATSECSVVRFCGPVSAEEDERSLSDASGGHLHVSPSPRDTTLRRSGYWNLELGGQEAQRVSSRRRGSSDDVAFLHAGSSHAT